MKNEFDKEYVTYADDGHNLRGKYYLIFMKKKPKYKLEENMKFAV